MALKNKKLFTDVETTGLDAKINGIHQIAGIIDIDGEEVERFSFLVRPFESDLIETKALDASGSTYDQIMQYPNPKEVHEQLLEVFKKHVNKFNRNDKFHFVAYNSPFDNSHYREFFNKIGDTYFGSWFFTPDICVMRQAAVLLQNERHLIDNFKQKTVAEYLEVVKNEDVIDWHQAIADVEITRKLYYTIIGQ